MTDCTHRYRLEEPHGPIVHGVCGHCGAERDWAASEDSQFLTTHAAQGWIVSQKRARDRRAKSVSGS